VTNKWDCLSQLRQNDWNFFAKGFKKIEEELDQERRFWDRKMHQKWFKEREHFFLTNLIKKREKEEKKLH